MALEQEPMSQRQLDAYVTTKGRMMNDMRDQVGDQVFHNFINDPIVHQWAKLEESRVQDISNNTKRWYESTKHTMPEDVQNKSNKLFRQLDRRIMTAEEFNHEMMRLHGDNHPLVRGSRRGNLNGDQFGNY